MKESPWTLRNREPILEVLRQYLVTNKSLLEVGSGTGQHAAFLGGKFPKLTWQTSDVKENHSEIQAWLDDFKLSNILYPIAFQVGVDRFPVGDFDFVFSANTLHIMSWDEVQLLIKLLGENLNKESMVFFYGPFNYKGTFTTGSNADFDQWLKNRNPKSGIRHFEKVEMCMQAAGFDLVKDHTMPANNRLLVFRK